tara:strand:- start:5373 stop:5558 length:186 start_codon:yes stop_codon:yes gene_type:complete
VAVYRHGSELFCSYLLITNLAGWGGAGTGRFDAFFDTHAIASTAGLVEVSIVRFSLDCAPP